MKLTVAALVFASMSTASCQRKSVQIDALKDLVSYWTLVKKQRANNLILDGEISTLEETQASQINALDAAYGIRVAGISSANTTKIASIQLEYTNAASALATETATAVANYNTILNRKVTGLQNQLTKAQQANGAKVTKLTAKQNSSASNLSRAQGRLTTKKNAQISANTIATSDKLAAIESKRAAKAGTISSKATRQLNRMQSRYDGQVSQISENLANDIATLEGRLKDAAGQLDSLDNASTTGLTYPSDCLLPVADVISLVKNDLSANQIWGSLV